MYSANTLLLPLSPNPYLPSSGNAAQVLFCMPSCLVLCLCLSLIVLYGKAGDLGLNEKIVSIAYPPLSGYSKTK